jgi:predicted alpha/beta-hydrolase family hydrolase
VKKETPTTVCQGARLGQRNSLEAYMVIHKIHLMNLKNAATLVPDAAR